MLTQLSKPLVVFVEKYLFDPFVFVIVLTIITISSAMFLEHTLSLRSFSIGAMVWAVTIFNAVPLILVNGYLLANTSFVGFAKPGRNASNSFKAIVVISLVSLFASWQLDFAWSSVLFC